MNGHFTRRHFIKGTASALVATTATITSSPAANTATQNEKRYDIMREVRKYRKIDSYATANFTEAGLKSQIEFADRFHIEKLFIAMPMTEIAATPDEFRSMNDTVFKAMKQYPDRFIGQFTFNAQFQRESLEEIDRCADRGMVGTRVYHQVKINDPLMFPCVEKLVQRKMILFAHGESQIGVGGFRMKYDAGKRHTISIPEDFVDVARRYPEAMLQFPHLGGGGDWEYMCKAFRNYPNIYVDVGGSNNQEHLVDFAVSTLGEDRVFFGSDNSFYQAIGKVLSAQLTEAQRKKVFFDNYNKMLKKGGYHVG